MGGTPIQCVGPTGRMCGKTLKVGKEIYLDL
jgi:hypothetical protein